MGMQRIVVIFSWQKKNGLLETNRGMQRDSSVLILNMGVKGGSATDITRRFDYAPGLASQLKVN
eukprot:1620803-Ditylum_brightwellii.AAC.1